MINNLRTRMVELEFLLAKEKSMVEIVRMNVSIMGEVHVFIYYFEVHVFIFKTLVHSGLCVNTQCLYSKIVCASNA